MKKLFFLSLMLCLLFESQAQKTDVPANSKSQSPDKSEKNVKKQKQYTTVLPLNKSESQMLLTGILTYSITYPDSVEADLMSNLFELQKFIDSKDTLSGYFQHVPVEAIGYVESKYFGKDGIIGYSPESDNRDIKSREQMLFYDIERIEKSKKAIEIEKGKIKNKVSFQCKYYTANGYPCPADTPKLEVTPVKNDEN